MESIVANTLFLSYSELCWYKDKTQPKIKDIPVYSRGLIDPRKERNRCKQEGRGEPEKKNFDLRSNSPKMSE